MAEDTLTMAGRIGTGKVYAADTTFVYIERSWATRDGRAMTKGGDRNAGKETPSEREEPGTCRMCQAPAHLPPHVSLCFRRHISGGWPDEILGTPLWH